MRYFDDFGIFGEWSGAALLVTETAKPGKRAFAAMWPQLGAPFGVLLANGFFLLLTLIFGYNSAEHGDDHVFIERVWRLPFLASSLFVAVWVWVLSFLGIDPVGPMGRVHDVRRRDPR